MFRLMKQFVPSRVCLACDGCCRFSEEKSFWRPKITLEEKGQVAGLDSIEAVFPDGTVDDSGHITTIPGVYTYVCTFFNVEDHACGIYNRRPFDCKLYPFVLVKTKGRVFLGVHRNCPYVQEHIESEDYKKYVAYLRKFLAQDNVMNFLQKNHRIIGEYLGCIEEIDRLFLLDIKT